MRGNKFEDPINGKKYNKLLPYGRLKSRENALAPDSMSLERHRLMWLFYNKKLTSSLKNLNFYMWLLNFALSIYLKKWRICNTLP